MPMEYRSSALTKVNGIKKLVALLRKQTIYLSTSEINDLLGLSITHARSSSRSFDYLLHEGFLEVSSRKHKFGVTNLYKLIASDAEIDAFYESLKTWHEPEFEPSGVPTKCDPWALPLSFFRSNQVPV